MFDRTPRDQHKLFGMTDCSGCVGSSGLGGLSIAKFWPVCKLQKSPTRGHAVPGFKIMNCDRFGPEPNNDDDGAG